MNFSQKLFDKSQSLTLDELLASKPKTANKNTELPASNSNFSEACQVEETLMIKHAKTKAKINAMRLKKQATEKKELQAAPTINKVSKQIAEIKEGKNESIVSSYANSIVSGTRQSLCRLMHPRQSFISLASLAGDDTSEKMKLHSGLHRKSDSLGMTDFQESVAPRIKDHVLEKQQELKNNKEIKKITVDELRKAIFMRDDVLEKEQKTERILEMSVIGRNEYWLSKKKEKLEKHKEKIAKQEKQLCPFSPALAPKVSIGRDSRKLSTHCNSYSQKYSKKQAPNEKIEKPTKAVLSYSCKSQPSFTFYSALSPHQVRVSTVDKLEILRSAIPMVPYNV